VYNSDAKTNLSYIEVDPHQCAVDPKEKQRHLGTESHRRLTESMRQHGLLQPPGVGAQGPPYPAYFGNGRILSAQDLGWKTIRVVAFSKPMTEQEYLLLKGIENTVRNDWTLPQLTDYLGELAATGMTQKEIAARLNMDEGLVSGHLTILRKGLPALLDAYRGGLPFTKTVVIARQEAQQAHGMLAEALSGTPAAELRQRARKRLNGSTKDQVRVNRIKIDVGNGVTVTVAGPNLSLDDGIIAVGDAKKVMEKGQKEGLTAKTISKASAERAASSAG
jgi:ParB/RepB/Spo0J family partition protein